MAEVIKGSSGKRRGKTTTEALSTEKRKREEDDLDLNLSSDIQGIIAALQNIREKAHKDDKKKSEETIASVSSEVKIILNGAKSKLEKERQTFVKALSKSSKECENSLKDEFSKFQSVYEKFSKEKAAHLQAFEDIFSKFDNEKEKLYLRYEQQSEKKEKSMLSEMEKTCADKITAAEESLKKKKRSILRKSLGSFLDGASDDDLPG
ncbi:hypothetical protein MKW92_001270 [Papaver armeniacum]|nr:hypothetical protein MKW92_001270 [Papaver armeniacum]